MMINGLKLPNLFVHSIETNKFHREIGSWFLKEEIDAFGNHLETDIGYMYSTITEIENQTAELKIYFPSDADLVDYSEDYKNEKGFIPYITEFSKVVEFGISGDGSPFCFDFRENLIEPSIIWWDDVYWRRIAPDFQSFIALFDFEK